MVVEAQVEIDALHLAVSQNVHARSQLILDGEADRVAQSLLQISRAVQPRLRRGIRAQFGVPAGKGPAADNGCRQQGCGTHWICLLYFALRLLSFELRSSKFNYSRSSSTTEVSSWRPVPLVKAKESSNKA